MPYSYILQVFKNVAPPRPPPPQKKNDLAKHIYGSLMSNTHYPMIKVLQDFLLPACLSPPPFPILCIMFSPRLPILNCL